MKQMEILFRAKRKDTKTWIKGWLVNNKNDKYAIELKFSYDLYEVIPETICQLRYVDSNGNQYFDNDIITGENKLLQTIVGRIIYKDGKTMVEKYENGEIIGYEDLCDIIQPEIVGNIFDNPEILNPSLEKRWEDISEKLVKEVIDEVSKKYLG